MPMVKAGTHGRDMAPWLMAGVTPVDVCAQSTDKVLGEAGNMDSATGIFTMDDGTVSSMNISRALPEVWPGALDGSKSGSSAVTAPSRLLSRRTSRR